MLYYNDFTQYISARHQRIQHCSAMDIGGMYKEECCRQYIAWPLGKQTCACTCAHAHTHYYIQRVN